MIEKNKLKRKTLLCQIREWYVLVYISQTYTNVQVLGYKVVSFLSLPPHCNGILSLLYSFTFSHLSLALVDQITNLLDTCPIKTFLKNVWVAVRLEVTVEASPPH